MISAFLVPRGHLHLWLSHYIYRSGGNWYTAAVGSCTFIDVGIGAGTGS